MIPFRLFVYGTLKRGYGNHRLLHGAEFLGEDCAPGILYGHGAPIMLPPESPVDWVKGEVYRVTEAPMLMRIDSLEGHPRAYTRSACTLRSGESAQAYYWLHDGSSKFAPWAQRITAMPGRPAEWRR